MPKAAFRIASEIRKKSLKYQLKFNMEWPPTSLIQAFHCDNHRKISA